MYKTAESATKFRFSDQNALEGVHLGEKAAYERLVDVSDIGQIAISNENSIKTTVIEKQPHSRVIESLMSKRRKLAVMGSVIVSTFGVANMTETGIAEAQPSTVAAAQAQHYDFARNPIRDPRTGGPLPCPDPDVFKWANKWVASCTSDYGQLNPFGSKGMGPVAAAFPIYESKNLKDWQFKNYIFPPGHHPDQSIAPQGHWPGGRYWADEIHHFGNKYEAYFGAQINQGTINWINKHYHENLQPKTFGLFVAWSKNLFGGNWQSRLLHFPGQFNNVPNNDREINGGVIDPTVSRDPRTGGLDIAWAKQANQIFTGQLSPDGLNMNKQVKFAIGASEPWECDPDCVVEGPVLYNDKRNGVMDLFYNASSTWLGTYKVGIAMNADPQNLPWTKYTHPILRSGSGLFGPGIGSQPFINPEGNLDMAFHIQLQPSHKSQARYLGIAPLNYNNNMLSIPSPADAKSAGAEEPSSKKTVEIVTVPIIGNGQTQH